MKTVFLRMVEADDKAIALLDAIREPERARGRQRFEVDTRDFANVPRSPFAYWASEKVLSLFCTLPAVEGDGRVARVTNPAGDDMRFFRAWWEPTPSSSLARAVWVPLNKGGSFAPFYFDVHMLVWWDRRVASYFGFLVTVHLLLIKLASMYFFFRAGLSWPLRTQKGLALRAIPAGCVFSHKGPTIFVDGGSDDALLPLLAVSNSLCFRFLASLQMAFGAYEVGVIQRTPIPRLAASDAQALAAIARRAWSLKRTLDTCIETSHAFTLPALLQVGGFDVASRAAAWSERTRTFSAELAAIQGKIDERCFALYGIDEADRLAIGEGLCARSLDVAPGDDGDPDDAGEDSVENESTVDGTGLAAELVSWAVGVAFGRFDMRLATGARPMPTEPEPFDPLPACSPSMLTGEDGLPLARPTAGYPLVFPETGVLVDDLGHAQDLPAAVRAVFDAVFGAETDRWWSDVAALLDPKGHDLRAWLADGFFEHHLKRHSKSRRKAPILWQLGTPSGRYSVWLYAHRLTRDTFFQLQNQSDGIVAQKLAHEERQLTNLVQRHGGNPSANERKEISTQEAFVEELRAMLDEIKRIAPLWNPNLDDGVVLTMAPLWRLVPQHKPWQKELKSKWDDLVARKYDWAHLAMHLWPEHVVPKCATDRSLAIAHGLEEVFWEQGSGGRVQGSEKWTPNPDARTLISDLVRERTSPAVKAALQSLLDAGEQRGGRPVQRARRRGSEPLVDSD